jgi:hypothetical protein
VRVVSDRGEKGRTVRGVDEPMLLPRKKCMGDLEVGSIVRIYFDYMYS